MNHYSESNQEVLRECPESIDGLLRELESIFEAPWGFKCTCGSDPEGHCDFCSEYEKARIKAKKLIVQWNTRTTPQEPPKHCSTCKHFKRIYPENYQLGVCEYLEVTDLQPCGHMIDRPPIASDKFVPAKGYNICVNRMIDSFGCVYHCPKEEDKLMNPTNNTELKSAEECAKDLRKALSKLHILIDPILSNKKTLIETHFEIAMLNAYKAGMTEAAETVQYWKSGHESRLRTFPNNCCIKSEIKDCEELRRVILAARDATKTI